MTTITVRYLYTERHTWGPQKTFSTGILWPYSYTLRSHRLLDYSTVENFILSVENMWKTVILREQWKSVLFLYFECVRCDTHETVHRGAWGLYWKDSVLGVEIFILCGRTDIYLLKSLTYKGPPSLSIFKFLSNKKNPRHKKKSPRVTERLLYNKKEGAETLLCASLESGSDFFY